MKATEGNSGTFEQAPAGTHIARCYKLVDLGTQDREFQGEVKRTRQVLIGWELPGELMKTGEYAGQPFSVSKFYTLSLHEKATLRAHLKNWRGREFTPAELEGFDLKNVLGHGCLLSVVMNDKGRAVVGGVMALPKGSTVPPAVNPTVYMSLDKDEFNQDVFDSFSEKMKAMITGSDEYIALTAKPKPPATAPAASSIDPEDIPF